MEFNTPNPDFYVGEHLIWGNLGHTAVVVSFIASLLAFIAFYFKQQNEQSPWAKIASAALWIHTFSVFAIFAILYYLIQSHYYEFQYVWQHSSNTLPKHYMISCFWEGQEGSFLLWMFWHAVIAVFLHLKPNRLSSGALSVLMLAQVVLSSMLLGINILGLKIGSSPFSLLREVQPEILDIPILKSIGKANYLQAIKDGSGLNPLLQNYWMVIHPPTLFLGFATAIVPFSYLISSFWSKDKSYWLKQVIPWTLFSVMILGTGIIMGGFWAYESLNFGGYWAWDPVENASLMPWLLLIAAAHLVLIFKNTGQYAVLTILLVCFSFFLVLYATFLTRSGVLGNASVHSFTDLGLSGQLLIFIFMFIFMAIYSSFENKKKAILFGLSFAAIALLNISNNSIASFLSTPVINVINLLAFGIFVFWWSKELLKLYPNKKVEENIWSREFWMFIGSLVLILSAFQIIFYTSAPVFNKLFQLNFAVQKEEFYNKFQLPFAIVIALLTAIGQYYFYRNTGKKEVWSKLILPLVLSIVISLIIAYVWSIFNLNYFLLLFFSVFTIVSNITFIFTKLKGKIILSGASIAHAGFGLMLIGILASSVNKHVISYNNIGKDFIEDDNSEKAQSFNRENMLLRMYDTVRIKDYLVSYDSVFEVGPDKFFRVKWMRLKDNKIVEQFELFPNAQNNPKMGLVANPDTRHYLHKDIYTHITHESSLEEIEDFKDFKLDTVGVGQNILTRSGMRKVSILGLDNLTSEDGKLIKIVAKLKIESEINKPKLMDASMIIDVTSNEIKYENAQSDEDGILVKLTTIIPQNPKEFNIVLTTAERRPKIDYIILKAIEFPWINLLWSGTIILVIGFTISIIFRVKELKKWKVQNPS
jgi:cytochrome c-type biogenesis protein CcmF